MNSNFDIQSPLRKGGSFITEEDLVGGSFLPNEAGALQMATIRLTDVELEKPYYLSLRAVDKAEKASQVSNLVVFFIPNKSVVVTTRNNNDENWGDSTEPEVNKEPSYNNVSSLLVAAFGLILIASLAVILLLAIVKHTQGYSSYKGIPI
jgi:calcium-activated chloride channel regulator 4